MKVIFRADASVQIGTGHVMRCLTLAGALRKYGANCEFICREHQGNQLQLIRESGYTVHLLPMGNVMGEGYDSDGCQKPAHASWLGSGWRVDAEQTLNVLGKDPVDWLIVDHYALDERWERQLRSGCNKLMVIDDLADRKHSCDVLLDQNLGRDVSDYAELVPEGCAVLVGANYALLRPEFAALREYSLRRRSLLQVKQLLVTMGGVDKGDMTSQVLEALRKCKLPGDFHICVVLGGGAPWLNRVRSISERMPWATEVLVNVSDMAKLMAESDLAIGAAGSTSWERCCLGLPTILVVLAENQRRIGESLVESGAAVMLHAETLSGSICAAVEGLLSQRAQLAALTSNACDVSDGRGVNRVVSKLLFL